MHEIENLAFLTELTEEESTTVNGGDAISDYIASTVAGTGNPFVGYAYWQIANQTVYPAASAYLNSAFSNGGVYGGLNAVQSLVNLAYSPIF